MANRLIVEGIDLRPPSAVSASLEPATTIATLTSGGPRMNGKYRFPANLELGFVAMATVLTTEKSKAGG